MDKGCTLPATEITSEKDVALYAKWHAATEGLTYTLSDGAYSVTGYQGTDTKVYIAGVYDGLPVTSIGDRAFIYTYNITRVAIPNGVTSIGEYALIGMGI